MRTRSRPFLVLLASVALALASVAQSVPAAADGFNGDVKIHQEPGETEPIVNNEPQVCSPFSIHGFNFDSSASGWWTITGWAPTADNDGANGVWTAGDTGEWTSGTLTLGDGHYKLEYDQTQPAPSGHAKHKVFWVDCAPTTGTLSVTKYNDLDNDGQRDANEGALSGWTFTAKDAAGATVGTLTTDASGTATLADLVPGTYSLVETMKPGWTNTDPGAGTKTGLAVTAGQTATATFGNHQTLALLLTSMCSVDPAVSREWRVRNPNAFDVPFTWEVYGTSQTGSGTALASSDVFFTTATLSGPNTTKVYWNGGETVKASGGATCAPTTGTLSVTKYNDIDNDGQRDANEGVLSGWTFTAKDAAGAVVGSMTTDATGTGTLANLVPGTYSLVETAKPGWTNTDPGGGTKTGLAVTAGQSATATFGNHYTAPPTDGTLRVLKYNDLDNDGSRDLANGTAGEPGLSGWSFTVQLLIEGAPSGDPQTITTGTDPLGEVTLTLAHGQYRVCEVLPLSSGWSFTDPDTDTPCKDVNVSTNEQTTVSFGNHYTAPPQNGSLRVFKYNDLDGNGEQGASESGLSQWSFTVTRSADVASLQPQSWDLVTGGDPLGFSNALSLSPGTYRVCESTPLSSGWANTDPGDGYCKTVGLEAGASMTVSFGNHYTYTPPTPQGTLNITKYHDRDADGMRDPGEPGLSGWTFEIRSGGFTFTTLTTVSDGTAALTLGPGTYAVVEVPQLGWTSVDPGGAIPTRTVTIADGQVTSIVFGNAQVILPPTSQTQIVVFKYADANANGTRDAGENGLAGFTFLIRSDSGAIVASAETDSFGLATITNLPLGGYTVVEQQRSGWFNTDPGGAAQKFVVLTSTGLIADVSFGNAQVRLPSTSTADDGGGTLWILLLVLGLGLTTTIAQRARAQR